MAKIEAKRKKQKAKKKEMKKVIETKYTSKKDCSSEIKYVPEDAMTEEFLIPFFYDNAELLCLRDYFTGNVQPQYIPEDKQTLPVLVAWELGKRRFENYSSENEYPFENYCDRLPYTGKMQEFKDLIVELADKVPLKNKYGYELQLLQEMRCDDS